MANLYHESHNPTSECDFDTQIQEYKRRDKPGNSCCWHFEHCLFHAAIFGVCRTGILSAKLVPGCFPESRDRSNHLDHCKPNHQIVITVPWQLGFRDHGCGNKRAEGGSKPVKAV